jgi:hypothetical protein
MPTITHAIITASIGALFYLITRNQSKQFKAEHLIVFALNGFVGPDWAKFLSPFFGVTYFSNPTFLAINGFSHSIFGWIFISPLFAGLYYFIFKLTQDAKISGNPPISYFHLLILIVAAGINHFSIDMLDGYVLIYPSIINSTYYLSLIDFETGYLLAEGPLWESFTWFGNKYLLLIGITFMVLLIWELKNKSLKVVIFTAVIFLITIYGLIFLIGSNIVKNEHDLGYAVYLAFGWIFPLYACYFSCDEKSIKTDPEKK